MLNQIVLVGRLTKDPELIKTENGKSVSSITLAIPRSFKNAEGTYDTDFISCTLWDKIAISTAEYCKKGSILGVRGRLQDKLIKEKDNNKHFLEVIAEKVTFLSNVKKET